MPTTTPADAPRGRGRPPSRHRPDGARKRNIYLTDAEFAAAQDRGRAAGIPADAWIRGLVLAALAPDAAPEKPRNPRRK